jgi:hypothetical protein
LHFRVIVPPFSLSPVDVKYFSIKFFGILI